MIHWWWTLVVGWITAIAGLLGGIRFGEAIERAQATSWPLDPERGEAKVPPGSNRAPLA
jgi:hypothetical protein